MKIFITGGAGYCGSVLSNLLLQLGYEITVFDRFFFNKSSDLSEKINCIKGDIRDKELLSKSIPGHDILIHLAAIANDASFELDPKLSTSINFECFYDLVTIAKSSGISRFIYASSSSVYGISNDSNVTEEHPLVPLTLYNKFKGDCEPILLSETSDNFCGTIFRPATVYGVSPRMRFDLSVNILTNHAVQKKRIKVFGGSQMRPNLHVTDYARAVITLMRADKSLVNNQIFNVSLENKSILELAYNVQKIVSGFYKVNSDSIPIEIVESSDNRSYHINSEKIYRVTGFKPQITLDQGIFEMCKAIHDGLYPDSFNNDKYFNVKRMLNLGIK